MTTGRRSINSVDSAMFILNESLTVVEPGQTGLTALGYGGL